MTAGSFQAMLGSVSGVSEVFPGGFVTYSETTKEQLLNLDSKMLEKYGTVSKECAEAMAIQAKKN